MGLLNRQQRKTLITLLKKLSYDSNPEGVRNILFGSLPSGLTQSISWTRIAAIDIPLLVDTIESEVWSPLPNGDYPIVFVIQNAFDHVSGSPLAVQLQTLLDGLQDPSIAISPPAYQLPKVSNFDLSRQIDDCFDELEPRHGLIGFAIPCDVPDFQDNFCERLLDKLREGHLDTEKRLPAPLKLKITSLDGAIQEIKRYKGILQCKNLLCPMQVQVYDEQGCTDLLVRFWQGLTNEFTGKFTHRLILLLLSDSTVACPPNIIPLAPPSFKEAHLRLWFAPIVRSLPWTSNDADVDQVIETWKSYAFTACQHNNQLAISYLYGYLSDTIGILKEKPSRERFFQELATRSQNYV